MNKSYLMVIFVVLFLSSSLVVNTALATKGWVTNHNPNMSHYAFNAGKVKICGDHKCVPYEFEKMQKTLYDAQRKNQASHFLKLNSTK